MGLHPRVRTGASGRHYTSSGALPMIPGIDGVGRPSHGQLVYFVCPDDTWGSMAERAVIDLRRMVPLPENAEVTKVAAAMNPAMSAWVASGAGSPSGPDSRCWCSGPLATPEQWPCRSPNASEQPV